MKKSELRDWLRDNAAYGNSCWIVINGGGASLVRPDEVDGLISDIMQDDYSEEVKMLPKGSEYKDFRSVMSAEEYDGTDCFILVEHLTGYNQENMDIQIQYWED